MRRLPLGRHAARTTLRDDADKHDHSIPGVDELLRLKPEHRPALPQHGEQPRHTLPAPQHLLALRIIGWHPNFHALVVEVPEQPVKKRVLIGGAQGQGEWALLRIEAADDLKLLLRHSAPVSTLSRT